MTEPSVPTPVPPAAQVAPPEQTIDGMVVAPATFGEDSTVAAGLEVAVRSQWDYARRRFVRHRLAMIGFVGLALKVVPRPLAPREEAEERSVGGGDRRHGPGETIERNAGPA